MVSDPLLKVPIEASGSPVHILQIITARQYRGAEVFAAQLSEGLAEQGHTVVLAGLYPPPASPLEAKGVKHVDLNGKRARLWSPALVRQVAQLIQEEQPSIIQANGADTLKYAILARRKLGIRTPIIYRNISIASQWLKSPVHRWFNTWLFRQVDHVVGVSEVALQDIRKTYSISRNRSTLISRGIPIPSEVDRKKSKEYLESVIGVVIKGNVLLHIGAFSPEKNHKALVRLVDRLKAKRPDVLLVMVGEGPLLQEVKDSISGKGLTQNIKVLGARMDIPQFMSAADVFILTSLIEGIPGVILEAQANEVPIVSYDVGSVFEAVADKGGKVPLGNEGVLFDTIDRLLSNPQSLREMGIAGRELMMSERSIATAIKRYEDLYYSLLLN